MGLLRRSSSIVTVTATPEREATDSGVVPIDSVVPRLPVRIVGEVTRMRARPTTGQPSLVVSVTDATGTVAVVWSGRRAIGGISLGRRLMIEGVPLMRGDRLEFTNPRYTLLPRA